MQELQQSTQQQPKQQEQKYFILDCLGDVVGNKKGYRTITSAQRMLNTKAIQDSIWGTYYSNRDKQIAQGISSEKLSNHLSSIKLMKY